MFADADHEVIDSAEALFRHLSEEHGLEEARELDPETAPVQFWLRRHAELERAQRAARRQPEPQPRSQAEPSSQAQAQARSQAGSGRGPVRQDAATAGRDGRRPAGFGDPLVEAMARALAGRGHDEGVVRAAIRSFAAERGPTGEAGVRAVFVEPMLHAVAERLLGAGGSQRPTGPSQPEAAAPASRATPARPAPDPAPAPPAPDRSPAPPSPDPAPAAPPRGEEPRPETAWAVLWADLADTRRQGRDDPGPAGDDGDDLMAVANAVQQRRRGRLLRR
jgi:hypothetical protein